MNRGVELTAIGISAENAWYQAIRENRAVASGQANFRDVDFDEDDLERPIDPDGAPDEDSEDDGDPVPAAAPASPSNPPAGVFSPVMVFENDVREFYARRHRDGRPGTRIVYRSGAPRLVKETYEEVKAKFAALGVQAD